MWTIFKVFNEFVTVLFLFYVLFFYEHEACGILAPWPGIKPAPPALEIEVLITGPPGKSLGYFLCCLWLQPLFLIKTALNLCTFFLIWSSFEIIPPPPPIFLASEIFFPYKFPYWTKPNSLLVITCGHSVLCWFSYS